MANPHSHVPSFAAAHASSAPGGHSSVAGPAPASRPRHPGGTGSADGDHQLEKLEFALAVALTRGDLQRSQQLRDAIEALGGNEEEPGT